MSEPKIDQAWSVADAKARFSEVLENAAKDGPQTIKRRGKEVAVVVGIEEWERKKQRKGTLLEFFQSAPVGDGVELDIERRNQEPRDVEL